MPEESPKPISAGEVRLNFLILDVVVALLFVMTIFNVVSAFLSTRDRRDLLESMDDLRKDYALRFDVAAKEYVRMTRSNENLRDRLSGDHAEIKAMLEAQAQAKVQIVPVAVPAPEAQKPEEKKER